MRRSPVLAAKRVNCQARQKQRTRGTSPLTGKRLSVALLTRGGQRPDEVAVPHNLAFHLQSHHDAFNRLPPREKPNRPHVGHHPQSQNVLSGLYGAPRDLQGAQVPEADGVVDSRGVEPVAHHLVTKHPGSVAGEGVEAPKLHALLLVHGSRRQLPPCSAPVSR
jgi:hypothetical protein